VCNALGLDTSGYSFTYVARWSDGDTDVIRGTAARAINCSRDILKSLEVARYEGQDTDSLKLTMMRS